MSANNANEPTSNTDGFGDDKTTDPIYQFIDPSDPQTSVVDLVARSISNDEMDKAVKELISVFDRGLISDEVCRDLIFRLFFKQEIHVSALIKYGISKYDRQHEEIASEVAVLLARRVLDPKSPFFTYDRARVSSASAFLRKASANVVRSKARDMRRADRRMGMPTDPSELIDWGHADGSVTFDIEPGSEIEQLERAYSPTEGFDAIRKGRRGMVARTRESVFAAVKMLDCATAVRFDAYEDRTWVNNAISEDPNLAHASIRAWLSLMNGRGQTTTDMDDRLLALWDDQTIESAQRIADADRRFANVLAIAATAPLARPDTKLIRKMRAVAATAERKGPRDKTPATRAWMQLSSVLVNAYVDTNYDATSAWSSVGQTSKDAREKGAVVGRSRYVQALRAAAAFDNHPMGRTTAEVESNLRVLAIANLHKGQDPMIPIMPRYVDENTERGEIAGITDDLMALAAGAA